MGSIPILPPIHKEIKIMSTYTGYTRARAEANAKYNLKTYQQEMFKLRTDEDSEIVASIEAAKARGISKREWLRELFYGQDA